MDLNRFLLERRPRWQRLARLLDKVDRVSLKGLAPDEVDELFRLYRLASSDLNLAQTRTANPAVLEYLEGLVGRAYSNLVTHERPKPFRAWRRIMRYRFPAVMRAERRLLAITTLAMMAGVLFGAILTLLDPNVAVVFLPSEHMSESPAERVADLESMEASGNTRVDTASKHALFTTFLFTHNIRVTVLGFALGLTFGIGTIIILFYNGAMLGSLAALYWQDGVMTFFVAWIGPHGAIELPCILFGCTAGLMLGRAQLRVEGGTTWRQIRDVRPRLVEIMVGTSTLLVLAGLIEGGFSQINEPTLPYKIKIMVAITLFIGLLAYLFVVPVEEKANEDETDFANIDDATIATDAA